MEKQFGSPFATSLEILKESVKPLKSTSIKSAISAQKHEEELKSLAETIRYQRFFFVVDILNQQIKHPQGISQWLGYNDSDFTFSFYTTLIHPDHVQATILLSKSIFDLANSKMISLEFMKEKYTIDIALRHAKGHYILVKRTLSCWDYDSQTGITTAYLNEFTILEEYESERSSGIKPRITDLYGSRLKDIELLLRDYSFNLLEDKKRFSVQELRLMRKYAYNPDLSSKEIAKSFKIENTTLETYNRRILTKFKSLYPNEEPKTARDVAAFLRREYFI
jgi:hypothetical protein